jgi:N-acetylglucosamine kinase-like BadF-type ATPase
VKAALARADGEILGEGKGGGLLHLAAPGGPERFVESIGAAVRSAWQAAGLEPQRLAALAMGLTGVTSAATPEARLAVELAGRLAPADRILADNDALAALKGAHAGGPGIICIAGTGSITLGCDPAGRLERAGGWGWLLGDEGSAFWIGRTGLRAALQAQEGLGPPTLLLEVMQRHFQVEPMIRVKRTVFAAEFGAQGFAGLAPLVQAAANQGDPVALQILARGGQELAQAVLAVANRLDFGAQPIPVCPVGGAFEHFETLRQAFAARLEQARNFQVHPPRYPAVIGAVIMARELLEKDKT